MIHWNHDMEKAPRDGREILIARRVRSHTWSAYVDVAYWDGDWIFADGEKEAPEASVIAWSSLNPPEART